MCSKLDHALSICGVAGGSAIAYSAPQSCHPYQRLQGGQLQQGAHCLTLSHPCPLSPGSACAGTLPSALKVVSLPALAAAPAGRRLTGGACMIAQLVESIVMTCCSTAWPTRPACILRSRSALASAEIGGGRPLDHAAQPLPPPVTLDGPAARVAFVSVCPVCSHL